VNAAASHREPKDPEILRQRRDTKTMRKPKRPGDCAGSGEETRPDRSEILVLLVRSDEGGFEHHCGGDGFDGGGRRGKGEAGTTKGPGCFEGIAAGRTLEAGAPHLGLLIAQVLPS
jgi:hypothetical protein